MKCDEKQIRDYLDGLVTPEEQKEIAGHLSDCKNCRLILTKTKQIKRMFAGYHTDLEFETIWPKLLDDPVEPPPLSSKVKESMSRLKKKFLREQLEKVLGALIAKGKESVLATGNVSALLDQFLEAMPHLKPVYGFTADTRMPGADVVLPGSADLDMILEIDGFEVRLRYTDSRLTITVSSGLKMPAAGMELQVKTASLGNINRVTDDKGMCSIDGIPLEPIHIKIQTKSGKK